MQPIHWSRRAQPPSYRGLGSGTAHVPLHLVGHVHPQVGVGSVEPAGLFLLLLLGMLAQGGDWDTILFEHKGSDCGWDFHFAFVFGFLLDKGVAVRIACSVALREQNRTGTVVEDRGPHLDWFNPKYPSDNGAARQA